MDWGPPGSSVHGISQEYWNWLSFPSPGNLPDPRIELAFPAVAGVFFFCLFCFLPLSHLGLLSNLHGNIGGDREKVIMSRVMVDAALRSDV